MKDPVRVAVIGRTRKGDYGHGLDKVWLEVPGAKIVAVADEDTDGRRQAAERLGVTAAYADYREMLQRERPQVVSVAPRWIDCHRDMVLACVEHGASVFLEKPLCRTLAEADEIVNASERAHVKIAVAHQTRYSPRLKVVRELLAAGRLGRLLEIRGRGKEDQRSGAEDLWVLGTHVFDLIRLLGGNALWCFGRVNQGDRPATGADVREGNEGIGRLVGDGVEAVFGLESGASAYFSSQRGAAASPTRFGVTVYGTKGVLEIGTGYLPPVHALFDPAWSPGRTSARWEAVSSAGAGVPEPLADSGVHGGNLLIAADLLAAIAEDRQPVGSVYEARAATEMIVAVFASHSRGGAVKLPLENRGDPLLDLR